MRFLFYCFGYLSEHPVLRLGLGLDLILIVVHDLLRHCRVLLDLRFDVDRRIPYVHMYSLERSHNLWIELNTCALRDYVMGLFMGLGPFVTSLRNKTVVNIGHRKYPCKYRDVASR